MRECCYRFLSAARISGDLRKAFARRWLLCSQGPVTISPPQIASITYEFAIAPDDPVAGTMIDTLLLPLAVPTARMAFTLPIRLLEFQVTDGYGHRESGRALSIPVAGIRFPTWAM